MNMNQENFGTFGNQPNQPNQPGGQPSQPGQPGVGGTSGQPHYGSGPGPAGYSNPNPFGGAQAGGPTPPPKPDPYDPMARELDLCWRTYQRMKEAAEAIAQREGIAPELTDTVHQAANQQFKECVSSVLLKYGSAAREAEHAAAQQAYAGARSETLGAEPHDNTTFYRSQHDKMLAGVCGGLADYFDIDSSLVRLAFAIGTVVLLITPAFFIFPLVYILLAILLPVKDDATVCKM